MKLHLPQYSFSGGALGTKMHGRYDLADLYRKAAKDIHNMIPTVQGPVVRRPGTRYCARAHCSNHDSRLIPFVYDSDNVYMLEFFEGGIRVYKNRAILYEPVYGVIANNQFNADIASWTDSSSTAAAATWDSSGAAYLQGTFQNVDGTYEGFYAETTTVSGGTGNAAISQMVTHGVTIGTCGRMFKVVFDVIENPSTLSGYGDGGEYLNPTRQRISIGTTLGGNDIHVEEVTGQGSKSVEFWTDQESFSIMIENVFSPQALVDNVELMVDKIIWKDLYLEEELFDISYELSGQVLYLAHQSHKPQILYRTSDYDWYFQDLQTIDGPYFDYADSQFSGRGTNITLDPSATSGTFVSVTASDNLFNESDVGRLLRFRHVDTADWGWAEIVAYGSPTQVYVNIKKTFSDQTASTEWTLGAWGPAVGYPGVVAASTGRVCWANTQSQPNGFWASRSSAPTVFSPDDNFDDNITASVAVSIALAEVTNITALASGNNRMFAGSSSGIFSISNLSEGFYGIQVQRVDSASTASIAPVKSQGSVFFASTGLRNLYAVSYTYEQLEEGYRADDVSIINDSYTIQALLEGTVSNSPNPILWYRTAAGTLLSLTFSRQDRIRAWARHTIGGTDAIVQSIASIPRGGSDDVWMIVKRTVEGESRRYIEYFEDVQTDLDEKEDVAYVDSSKYYGGGNTQEIYGMSHLKGETLAGTGNGANLPNIGADSIGMVGTEFPVSSAQIGLAYESSVTMLQMDGGSGVGSVWGRPYRVSDVRVRFIGSNGCDLGFEQSALQNFNGMIYFNDSPQYGVGDDLYTGWKRLRVASGYLPEVNLTLTSVGALALNIAVVSLEIEGSEF